MKILKAHIKLQMLLIAFHLEPFKNRNYHVEQTSVRNAILWLKAVYNNDSR